MSGRSVSRWETGINMPDISLLVEIAEFYDVSISEIIDGERKSEKMNEEVKKNSIKVIRLHRNYKQDYKKKTIFLNNYCIYRNVSICND